MRRKGITIKSAEEPSAEIDLTPMLDVVFIMLIFFIVTATFIKEAGIEVKRAPAITQEEIANQKILIAINAEDEIWMNKERVDERSLRSRIERVHVENPKGAVVIQADEESSVKMYALVYDAARAAGVVGIYPATSEK
jgi:biopolymer transport protein ExbD